MSLFKKSFRPDELDKKTFEMAIRLWRDSVIQEVVKDPSKLPPGLASN